MRFPLQRLHGQHIGSVATITQMQLMSEKMGTEWFGGMKTGAPGQQSQRPKGG